jgi:hypothetical protein
MTGAFDLGNPDRTTWATATRNTLNRAGGCDPNVVMWSWCGQVSSATEADTNTYLSLMNQLELDFPGVTFVYMTGHLEGGGATRFTPLAPCRGLDTRTAEGAAAAAPVLGASSGRVFTITGRCGVPADARGVSANITVVSATSAGDLRVVGGHLTSTLTSSLSIPTNRARANNGIVRLSAFGDSSIAVINDSSGTVHFILDINGFFR